MAEGLTIAVWNAELVRKGPGLLLRDLLRGREADVQVAVATIDALGADVLVLAGFDFDAGGAALEALNARLARPYPHLVPLRPNTGVPTGLDLDGNGRVDEARDAQGFGWFPGQGGMAILSRLPPEPALARDFSHLLWRDLPGNLIPGSLPDEAREVLRLSTTGHHETALRLADGEVLRMLTWHATTPAFDGPEDLNGRRNHDETMFWLRLIEEALPQPAPHRPFVLAGISNLDPEAGDGRREAMRSLLDASALQDLGGGPTADFGAAIGRLRVAYVLPSGGLGVAASGVRRDLGGRHWPVWARLDLPAPLDPAAAAD